MSTPNSQVTEQVQTLREILLDYGEDENGPRYTMERSALNAAIAALTARTEAEPANLGEFVIALLIAGGYVTQAKADEARKIALSTGPYEMPAPPAAEEGFVVDQAAIESLVAGPFMYHHKMNELQEREAKGFDRCRELTLKNIEIYFATRTAMLARPQPAQVFAAYDDSGNFTPATHTQLAQGDGWLPIESAPRDGTRVLLASSHGTWMAEYRPVYVSGYRPKDPWFSVMLNTDHIPRNVRYEKPTHWRPLPPPPAPADGGKK